MNNLQRIAQLLTHRFFAVGCLAGCRCVQRACVERNTFIPFSAVANAAIVAVNANTLTCTAAPLLSSALSPRCLFYQGSG